MRNKTILISLILIVFCGMGCGVRLDKAELVADDPAAQIKQLRNELADTRSQVEKLNKQLTVLRGFTADRMEYLVRVDQVKFGRFTRGYDENKDGLDEGINVYVVLNDELGDKIKAAGEVGIELWDLAADEGRRLIQKRRYGLSEVADHWLSGFMTDHYKFRLAWSKEKRPSHPNLTLKLNFKEALTGNVFEIQKLITTSASRPQR